MHWTSLRYTTLSFVSEYIKVFLGPKNEFLLPKNLKDIQATVYPLE